MIVLGSTTEMESRVNDNSSLVFFFLVLCQCNPIFFKNKTPLVFSDYSHNATKENTSPEKTKKRCPQLLKPLALYARVSTMFVCMSAFLLVLLHCAVSVSRSGVNTGWVVSNLGSMWCRA